MIKDHKPVPGPLHWDWRCLVCEAPVAHHETRFDRVLARFHGVVLLVLLATLAAIVILAVSAAGHP